MPKWEDAVATLWTRDMAGLGKFRGIGIFCFLLLFGGMLQAKPVAPNQAAEALHATLQKTSAIAIVLDVRSGQILATEKPVQVANLRSKPGSVLKPFFLAEALEKNRLSSQTTVLCRRSLRIAGRDLPCSHPRTGIAFTAEEALAYSCNNYFVEVANRLSPEQARNTLEAYGLSQQPRLFPVEASPELKIPVTPEQKQLLVLGLEGIKVTPAQLAAAYRKLALKLSETQIPPALQTVEQGLLDSVQYGMAHNAEVSGISILGKTGTANDTPQGWSHGWFAGIIQIGVSKIVMVLYVPHGNGGDAAHLAQRFLLTYRNATEK